MSRISSDVEINCRQPQRKTPCCPDCGALECLCRPRFFAGQLLSEQDLNRLDQYIKNKGRLHNRNLHGWGVVNGLMVLCDPCGELKVTPGYAVDPCGDDIVVCENTTVNICDLIRKCKQQEPQPPCQPFYSPPNVRCDEVEEEWVLTIKYREWASRGVTALRGNACRSGACNCGASATGAACSCGSGGATSAKSATVTTYRGAPPQCEPTVTCEGYSFDVYKKPVTDPKQDEGQLIQLSGAFWDAFNCCAEPLVATVPPTPDLSNDDNMVQLANAVTQWCCQWRDNLINYYLTHPNTTCEIIDFLRAVNCPSIASPGSFVNDFIRSFLQLLAAWAEGLRNCFCLALMPPPPQPTDDVRVPLASVRIRMRDCRILSICNWTQERKIMMTWPAVAHWLGIVPIGDLIRELIDRLCCTSLLHVFDDVLQKYPPTEGLAHKAFALHAAPPGAAETEQAASFSQAMHLASGSLTARFSTHLGTKMESFSNLVDKVLLRGNKPLELGAILNSVSPRFKLPDNGAKLSAVEAKNLPLLLISELTVKPVLTTVLGSGAAARVADFQQTLGKGAKTAAGGAATNVQLQRQVEEMRVRMAQQEEQIKILLDKTK